MQIIGFRKADLILVQSYYQALAEDYKDKPDTYAGYMGRAAMIRDLMWNWNPTLAVAQRYPSKRGRSNE